MSQVKVSSIVDTSGGNTVTINGYTPTLSNMAGRNRIINGDMRIDQRNAGASFTPTASTQYNIDRFATYVNQTSKFSVQQNAGSVTPPVGFTNYLGVTSLSSYSSTSTDQFVLIQPVEGYTISDFGLGTANAQTVTLSFWVRSSLTGTFGGSFRNNNADRSYVFNYTISSANTWEQKSITLTLDTTGTWLGTNNRALIVGFDLGSGPALKTTAGSWQTGNFTGVTGATSVVGTSGATFYITGVQLEAGSVATPFERRDYGRELIMCQRYYQKSFPLGVAPVNGSNTNPSGSVTRNIVPYSTTGAYSDTVAFEVRMRAAPSVTIYNTDAITTPGAFAYFDGAWKAASLTPVYQIRDNGFVVEPSGSYTAWVPRLGVFAWAASAEL